MALRGLNGTCMARSLLDRLAGCGDRVWITRLSWGFWLERAMEQAKVSERAKVRGTTPVDQDHRHDLDNAPE